MAETTTPVKQEKKQAPAPDEKAVAVYENNNSGGTAIAKASDTKKVFSVADLSDTANIPDLEKANVLPVDLMSEYWTPQGLETKRVFFSHIEASDYPVEATGEVKRLDTVYLVEQRKTEKGKELVMISNASARLVGKILDYVNQGAIQYGTALMITYKGKIKNKTNQFSSDNWGVFPIELQLPVKD